MTIRKLLGVAAALAGVALAGNLTDYDGPPRWERPVVTITADLAPAAAQWGDTVTFTVTAPADADITTTAAEPGGTMVGAEAHRTFRDGHYIAACEISTGPDVALPILTHELGHCLGLSHHSAPGSSVMHWFAGDYQGGWSDTPTSADLDALTTLYTNR